MRKVRVVVSMVGGAPVIALAALVPAGACAAPHGRHAGGLPEYATGRIENDRRVEVIVERDARAESSVDAGDGVRRSRCKPGLFAVDWTGDGPGEPWEPMCRNAPNDGGVVYGRDTVDLTLTRFSPTGPEIEGFFRWSKDAKGNVIPASVRIEAVGDPAFEAMQLTAFKVETEGVRFAATWPAPIALDPVFTPSLALRIHYDIACAAGVRTVREDEPLAACLRDDNTVELASDGPCIICTVIAEMAPSPIVSDNRGDDLPLGLVTSVRVKTLLRIGNDVVLQAEHDGLPDATFEWRTSGGTLEQIAPDVVLWRVPTEQRTPFGQVAMWSEHGAAVENFLWGVA